MVDGSAADRSTSVSPPGQKRRAADSLTTFGDTRLPAHVQQIADLQSRQGTLQAQLDQARTLFAEVALAPEFADFLTVPAYGLID